MTVLLRPLTVLVLVGVTVAPVHAYPIDGFERTGIRRLLGRQHAEEAASGWRKLPSGARLGTTDVRLALAGGNVAWDLTGVDKAADLQAAIESIFASRDPSYSVAVIDVTDPAQPAWAGVRETQTQYPGSVGKVLVMTGLFDALARAFPDPKDRLRILTTRDVVASDWAMTDSHAVPHYLEESGFNHWGPIRKGETFTLAEWVDHMVSPSANAAGSTVWKEAMLLRHFGAAYPPSAEAEEEYFAKTSKTARRDLALAVLAEPLEAAGLDASQLRQGSMFTQGGKARVPGVSSYASARELVRLLLRMEQGRLVDEWSSLEMKRYLYLTKKRYRYCYAPELHAAAVYFKSGSLYSCQEEEGFRCGKYRGNVKNLMNSIAIVESPAVPLVGQVQRRYLVALMSNVLRKNSAWDHSRLGAAIDEAVHTRARVQVKEEGASGEVQEAGSSN